MLNSSKASVIWLTLVLFSDSLDFPQKLFNINVVVFGPGFLDIWPLSKSIPAQVNKKFTKHFVSCIFP